MSEQDINIPFVPKPTRHNFIDIEGQQFGFLTVIGYAGKRNKAHFWYVRCSCGVVKTIRQGNLAVVKSCGCLLKRGDHSAVQHGEARNFRHSPEYSSYHDAKGRCRNPKNKYYKNYGGRGIEFHFTSFEDFLAEVGRRPSPKHTLDREDNNGHYKKGNLRWVTRDIQNINKRDNVLLSIYGVTRTATEWSAITGVRADVIWARKRWGWCDICAATNGRFVFCRHK